MASIRKRVRKDGTPSWQVLWRDAKGVQSSVTFLTEPEARTLRASLDANGGNFEAAQEVLAPITSTRTVAAVLTEHIDMLIKPGPQCIRNYRAYAKNHINPSIGGVPIEQLTRQQVAAWVRGLMDKDTGGGRHMAPATIRAIHTLLTSALETAVKLEYRANNPARGVDLPSMVRADDDVMFLTLAEFELINRHMDPHYQLFTKFLVMTGCRFGEATALNIGNVNLDASPANVRIVRAWKTDGRGGWYLGPPKSVTSRRTVTIPATLADLLRPIVEAATDPDQLVFHSDNDGERIRQQRFFQSFWMKAVKAARADDPKFTKRPKVHHLRHTHATWLVQAGVDLFKIARRLGHSDTTMLQQRYAHLMPEAQAEMASAIGRIMVGELPAGSDAAEIVGPEV